MKGNRDMYDEQTHNLIKSILDKKTRGNVDPVLTASARWKPKPASRIRTFNSEMSARYEYLHGSMVRDMDEEICRRFPLSKERIRDEQLNVKLFKRVIENKAKVFGRQPRAFLMRNGEEIDPTDESAIAFSWILRSGAVWTALKHADAITQGLGRACVKVGWDQRRSRVLLSVWPQHQVHVVPDPIQYWDIDAAPIVLFELPASDGVNSTDRRYEVWAKSKGESGEWVGVHYIAASRTEHGAKIKKWVSQSVNESDTIPIVDAADEPVYPFTWWRSDMNLSLYWLGDEDSLTPNRAINSGLTDMHYGQHFNGHPVKFWERQGEWKGDNEPTVPSNHSINPDEFIPGTDVRPAFSRPDYDAPAVLDMWTRFLGVALRLDAGGSQSIIDDGPPASGYAYQMQQLPLTEHRENMFEIYRPQVLDTLDKIVSVHNHFARDAGMPLVNIDLKIGFEFGDIDPPVDREAQSRVWQVAIGNNVASIADWRMDMFDEDRETAELKILENKAFNDSILGVGSNAGLDAIASIDTGSDPDSGSTGEQQQAENENALTPDRAPNVYEFVRMIQAGSATPVDLRMAYFGEDRATAEAAVQRAIEFNKKIASELGESEAKRLVEIAGVERSGGTIGGEDDE